MAHFAEIDALKRVLRVLVIDDKDTQDKHGKEVESVGAKYLRDGFGGTWIKTSYNTRGGGHTLGGTPIRKNHAGIGSTYDESKDAFIPAKPFPSWTLDETTCLWKPPVVKPPFAGKPYDWNEVTKSWDERT
tara:strand:- start:352 stop:744 length:393 start_codon:yes stop_codon:yes gene_type:complete